MSHSYVTRPIDNTGLHGVPILPYYLRI